MKKGKEILFTVKPQYGFGEEGNQASGDEARNVDGFNNRLLHLLLGNSDSQHSILHGGLHLIHLRILRQPEPAEEPPAAPLHAVPPVLLLFMLLLPLPAYLQHPPFLDLHLHLLLLQPRQVRLEHVRLRGLLPVDGGAATSVLKDFAKILSPMLVLKIAVGTDTVPALALPNVDIAKTGVLAALLYWK
ncbi:hypothetical protein RJ640_025974 [Escallonia rubra]|uniref:Uncharacterized protein n=1 Tax=Escallonia rubra TaxID=112253 RepID=A0AA88QKS2_9ASTE|nr:hypothetical protein RJ640_025974 [Escallonia rubra]